MSLFSRKYYVYPEIQRPLIKYVVISVLCVSFLQSALVYFSMKWLGVQTGADISIVVDYRILGAWQKLLYVSILVPITMNFILGFGFILFFSNRFAGPLYRLERELDLYLDGSQKNLNVKFRESDFLQPLANKINRLK